RISAWAWARVVGSSATGVVIAAITAESPLFAQNFQRPDSIRRRLSALSPPIADASPPPDAPSSSPARRPARAAAHGSAAPGSAQSSASRTAAPRASWQIGIPRCRPTPRSSPGRPNKRHSAYSLRSATIAYPWHPLFGRTLQVAPFRRGKDLKCIYTEERRGFSREVPNWMFDESYCAGMALGPPQVSIDGLNELAVVLKLL